MTACLLGLPTETVEQIASYLELADLYALRLSHPRVLADKTHDRLRSIHPWNANYFHCGRTKFNSDGAWSPDCYRPQGWNVALTEVCRHQTYSGWITRICLRAHGIDDEGEVLRRLGRIIYRLPNLKYLYLVERYGENIVSSIIRDIAVTKHKSLAPLRRIYLEYVCTDAGYLAKFIQRYQSTLTHIVFLAVGLFTGRWTLDIAPALQKCQLKYLRVDTMFAEDARGWKSVGLLKMSSEGKVLANTKSFEIRGAAAIQASMQEMSRFREVSGWDAVVVPDRS